MTCPHGHLTAELCPHCLGLDSMATCPKCGGIMICPMCSGLVVDANLPNIVTVTCVACGGKFPSVEAYSAHVVGCTRDRRLG